MEKQESKPNPPCPLCGGTTFTDGSLTNVMRAGGPFFQPEPDKTSQLIPRPTIVKALACQACGYILLFRTTRS
jgi:rubredoxin